MTRARPWSSTFSATDSVWSEIWPQLIAAGEFGSGSAIFEEQLNLLEKAGVFTALVPEEYGGFEMEGPAALAVIEDLAYINGTLGWTACVGVAGGLFSFELPPAGAHEIWSGSHPLISYAGANSGTLTPSGDGFILSGSWDMASGVTHATWVALGCTVEGGHPAATAVALVHRSECQLGSPWVPVGLAGASTAPVSIDAVPVPRQRITFDVTDDQSSHTRRRYRFLIPRAMGAVSLGIGFACLDSLASRHVRPDAEQMKHQLLGHSYAQLLAARSFLHEATADVWRRASHGQASELEPNARQRLAATHAAHVANQVADAASRMGGMAAITQGTSTSERWLEARTITANITVGDLYYRVYGGVAADGRAPLSWP
ncbi:hypothetical protein ACFUJY_00610 [Streptomyces sp. NPDC057249]|uniref:hypothetical protein n=1 Tax=Streptomyces sp. NPDC057249 TaxID=3346067 RepID=UPI003628AF25